MLTYEVTLGIAKAVIDKVPSPFISHNRKTIASVDFGICGLMRKGKGGRYSSKVCPGCYSATLINVYKSLRTKIEGLPMPDDEGQLEAFEESLKMLRAYVVPLKRLRFYSLADFHPSHMPYIRLAAKYFEIDIISKALSFPQNEDCLKELMETDNVWISLSFNKQFMTYFDRIVELVRDADRVGLNYTLNYTEENPDKLPFRDLISVWHIKNDRKRYILDQGEFVTLSELNVCGVFDGDGNRNTYKRERRGQGNRIYEEKGSCHSCNNCRCSLKMLIEGESASLPEKLLTA